MTVYRDQHQLPKVLIVDDSSENLVATKKILAQEPIEVFCARSGNEALILLLNHSFAVILLDVQMPGMDGFEVAGLIRGNEDTQNIPIIFVTATRKDEAYFSAGYSAGAVDYLTKPICEEFLLSKIRIFLELHNQRMELLRVAAELSQGKKELEASNQALNDFAHAAAHDLKAPVRHIRAWIGMIFNYQGGELSAKVTHLLERIDQSATQMNDLISGLLAYATLGTAEPSFESVDLDQILKDVLATFIQVIEESAAVVEVTDMPTVKGDRILLYQLFQNLVGNALKYRKPDIAPVIKICCAVNRQQGQCQISVVDNGIGFDPLFANEIFEPFRRLVTKNEFEGSGIGLSTVKKLVEYHGGTIHAKSSVGAGSTFTVMLPVLDETEALPISPPPTALLAIDEPSSSRNHSAPHIQRDSDV